MKSTVCTVYDSAAKAYLQPFYQAGKGTAFRAFQDAVNDEKSQFHKHPKDYSLFIIGTFDDEKCTFDMLPRPEMVVSAVEVLEPIKKVPIPWNGDARCMKCGRTKPHMDSVCPDCGK